MSNLTLIAGLAPASARLLETAGVRNVEDLARHDAPLLFQRLIGSNGGPTAGTPALTPDEVARWISQARSLAGGLPRTHRALPVGARHPGDLAINLDEVPEVIVLGAVASAPVASRAAAPAIKKAPDLREVVEQALPVAIRPAAGPVQTPRSQTAVAPSAIASSKELPTAEFRDFAAYEAGDHGIAPLPRRSPDDDEEADGSGRRVSVKAGESLPRQVRRGVPHPRPVFLIFSSLIVLISRLLMMVVIIGTPIVLTPAFMRGDTKLLLGFLWVIGAWLVSCVFYLLIALRARCRICTNQIFFSKRCFKNARAHRVFGLGLVGSLALHALMFGWFRCMYCGTAIRIKLGGDPERRR